AKSTVASAATQRSSRRRASTAKRTSAARLQRSGKSRSAYSPFPKRCVSPFSTSKKPDGADTVNARGPRSAPAERSMMLSATADSSYHKERFAAYWKILTAHPSTTAAAMTASAPSVQLRTDAAEDTCRSRERTRATTYRRPHDADCDSARGTPGRAKGTACNGRMIEDIGGLSVIIPATDSPAMLDATIAAAERASMPPDEVIVVRGAATPGPAAARNDGARQAGGDILVFVDADVEVHSDAFERIRAAFAGDPSLAAVFGSYDDAPREQALVSSFRNLLHHHVHTSSAGPATTFWAGLGAVRRDAFFAVDGFDEHRYRVPSIEDIDLGARLHAAGYRIVLDP